MRQRAVAGVGGGGHLRRRSHVKKGLVAGRGSRELGGVLALVVALTMASAVLPAVAMLPAALLPGDGWFGAVRTELQAQESHLLLVTGLGGDPAYADEFHAWAGAIREAALEGGVAPERVVWLSDEPERAPDVIRDQARAETLEAAVGDLAERSAPGDRILAVFIGHGTARGDEASFNLRGPDISGGDLATMLRPLEDRTVAVVNTAPSSGPWVAALAGPDRIVITATKTARERNETRFGAFFSEAFGQDVADLDKDGRTSLLEAFRYARREVERSYGEENLLMTEHPVLEDDADGTGSEVPGGDGAAVAPTGDGEEAEAGPDGLLASRFFLTPRRRAVVAEDGADGVQDRRGERPDPEDVTDPELRRLYEVRDSLEASVAELRTRRGEMEEEAYERALEALLVELAQTAGAIREREGGGGA